MPTALPLGTVNLMRIVARSAARVHRPAGTRSYALPVAWEETSQGPQAIPVRVRPEACLLPESAGPTIHPAAGMPGISELVF